MAVGDIDLDGVPDLVTAQPDSDRLQLLIGRGDGTFADPQDILLDSGPVAVMLQDVDGDGRLDFVTSTPDEDAVSIVYNHVLAKQYRYQVKATDPDTDPLTYALPTRPAGMLINPIDGTITWRPTRQQLGPNDVTVAVSDGRGGLATQSSWFKSRRARIMPRRTFSVHRQPPPRH